MGASIPQVSRRVHWRACQFGKILNRCGTERRSSWPTPAVGVQPIGLCQAKGGLSIGGQIHGVDEFGWRDGSISLLVYQIGARFLGHRALALVLQCCVASKA